MGWKILMFRRKTPIPSYMFGFNITGHVWEKYIAGDFMRLQIMQEFGGIYLDNDIYVVHSLDRYRQYEVSHFGNHRPTTKAS